MESNIKGLVSAGHEMASELKAECGAVDMRSVAKLISDLATQLEVQLVRANALAEDQQKAIESIKQADSAVKLAHEKFSALAAENAAMHETIEAVRSVADNSSGIAGWHLNGDIATWEEILPEINDIETPATDAFLAEVRASSIPEGYVLVPQQIFLEPSDIESICSQCGDGHESGYGDFTNGLLWVGNIQCDDGSIVHGLHISSADYSEEGGVTVCEFAAQLRKGGNQ
ncbi:TPA: eae-like domain protein [Escherichia coli]|nr:eae-like domain protein [Escherichia coli]